MSRTLSIALTVTSPHSTTHCVISFIQLLSFLSHIDIDRLSLIDFCRFTGVQGGPPLISHFSSTNFILYLCSNQLILTHNHVTIKFRLALIEVFLTHCHHINCFTVIVDSWQPCMIVYTGICIPKDVLCKSKFHCEW